MTSSVHNDPVAWRSLLIAALLSAAACSGGSAAQPASTGELPPPDGRLFSRLPSSYTGVTFANQLEETRELNVFTYRNYFNGGGVAAGDLTGDGLPDLVLTSNQGGPRLYVNAGGFRFREVTRAAGIEVADDSWTTGAVLADVNGDGRLDVYVCHSGPAAPARRANALWINQGLDEDGVPRFENEAESYGVADQGFSTHAAFLDYDRDGDLDLFVINNSPRPVSSFGQRNMRHVRDPWGGHKLYRNEGRVAGGSTARFADVSAAAGIHGSEIGFGLGLAVGDVNRDGWPDIYVSNDFFERDYLFVNKGDGTFAETLDQQTSTITYFSMGLDIADIDGDQWPDIYTTDMLPEDDRRLKLTGMFEGWDVYRTKVRNGYHHQFMRNMLQRNNTDGTFSDVGWMAGVAATDWSWSALLADLDLDGRTDIFVTNGIAKDITSQDYVAFLANEETMRAATNDGRSKVDFGVLSRALTSTKLPNYAFRNLGELRFASEAKGWGLDTPGFSSGAAYVDLDADGALDLVVNNVNDEAFVYRNNARALHPTHHFLRVRLEGEGANRFAVGARVTVHAGPDGLMQELAPARGFQSSVDYVLNFGLGARTAVDSVLVEWPDGRTTAVRPGRVDTLLIVRQTGATAPPSRSAPMVPPHLAAVGDSTTLAFVHEENDFVDFDRERLIPRMLSMEGPALAVADVNGDGLDDVYLGGAREQAGQLLLQQPDGRFSRSNAGLFEADAISEDVGAVFFDANGDRRPDLYVTSGGSEYPEEAPALLDRLYLNDGRGTFRKTTDHLPMIASSGSRPAAADWDGDGDIDLFVGGRLVPWHYGTAPQSVLLQNDGRGRFTDVAARVAPELARVGMVTDAAWRDVDADGRVDLVVVGEWMPVTIFRNAGGRLTKLEVPGLAKSHGWWNRVVVGDFTGDGRPDFLVGNLGLNSRLQATERDPLTMLVKDFDGNGSTEQVVATSSGGKRYTLALRDDLIRALPYLKARFLKHEDFAGKTLDEILPPAEQQGATVHTAYTFATSLVRNDGRGQFTMVPLPREAQLAPIYGILPADVDADGHLDLLLAGNFDGVRPEVGRLHASRGLVLRGDGNGGFVPLPAPRSGFVVPGQARDIQRVRTRDGALYLVARNDDRPLLFHDHGSRGARPVARRSTTR